MSVLIFDIQRKNNTLEKRINRQLNSLGAKMLQHSVWKTNKNEELIRIASEIKHFGGKAMILEERMIFK